MRGALKAVIAACCRLQPSQSQHRMRPKGLQDCASFAGRISSKREKRLQSKAGMDHSPLVVGQATAPVLKVGCWLLGWPLGCLNPKEALLPRWLGRQPSTAFLSYHTGSYALDTPTSFSCNSTGLSARAERTNVTSKGRPKEPIWDSMLDGVMNAPCWCRAWRQFEQYTRNSTA